MRRRYSHFMRVTRKGWEVLPGFEWSEKLALIVEFKNYQFKNDPEILLGVRESFRKAQQMCHWCIRFMEAGFKTCHFCGNRRCEVIK